MGARLKAGQSVNGRAIFCLTDHSIAGRVCQIRTGGGRIFINCDSKHGAVQVAVQSPESERAARIHGKRETSQLGLPIA
jgi:lysyl-tRNA synthetase class II